LIGACQGSRTGNYTMAEDMFLCKTWLTIGMDPTTGTNQTRETYWMRIKEYFDANNICYVRSRWSVINADCEKWAGV
jgi:hypothetical protein